ncbi:MAG: alpha/beta hydrolase [Ignavibacteriae bacterium]|nr:alpha/beta hydrolase [Ignavibacteriota bacterium]
MNLRYKHINVHYSDKGKGTAIVLLHGFLENSTMWKPFISKLTKKNRVVTIDLLGHGKTECLGYVHTMEEMSEAIKAVLTKLRLRRVVLIGHSMGGYVTLAFAEKYSNNVKGLCLMNSTATADNMEKRINRDRAIVAVKHNHKSFVKISISNLFRPKNRPIFADEINKVKGEALKIPLQGIVAALEGMKIRKDRTKLLKSKAFKKMMIIGKHDPVLDQDSLIKQIKNTDVKIIEFQDGHMSHIENKKEFSEQIMHFIEKI